MATPKKGLSAGTMNLKFMSRGSGDTPIPGLEKKKVVDEGEWDVGPAVRKALGLSEAEASSSSGPSSSITYESSYMPFLTTQGVKGRFSFRDGAKQERIEAPAPAVEASTVDESRPSGSSARPKAISRQQPPKASPQSRTPAQSAPTSSTPDATPSPAKPATFMRPAGVDAAPSSSPNPKKRSSVDESSKKHRRSDSAASGSVANGSQHKTKKKKKTHGSMEVDS